MKKFEIILITLLGIIIVTAVAYVTFENYKEVPTDGQLTEIVNPVVSSETFANSLIGPKWSWERTIISKDEIIFPRTHDVFTIKFEENGTLYGTTDCNNFSGPYEKNENKLSFGLFLSTEMYCENSKEEFFKKTLTEVEELSFSEEGKLILKSATSSVVFVDKESDQNEKNWNRIKQAVANCNIKDGGQTHSREVTVTLKNGEKLKAYSPKIDNIFDIVNDSKEKCGKVMLWTE